MRRKNNLETNNWNKYYQNANQLWSSNPDFRLMQYFDLIKKGNVLDLGIGEGRNSIPFALSDFNIDGVDTFEPALSRCKEIFKGINTTINLISCDLREYDIKSDNYNLIIVANVLNFFKKSEIDMIVQKIKTGLKEDGILYLTVFSILEPKFSILDLNQEKVEENTFYIEERNSYVHYFTQKELNVYFSDFELICLFEGIEYDTSHGIPHYHGGIDFMARKKRDI